MTNKTKKIANVFVIATAIVFLTMGFVSACAPQPASASWSQCDSWSQSSSWDCQQTPPVCTQGQLDKGDTDVNGQCVAPTPPPSPQPVPQPQPVPVPAPTPTPVTSPPVQPQPQPEQLPPPPTWGK